ncbi:MAG: hypothetical protein DRO93_05480, partial [Candidatus Thorarchaeota archaeon]
MSAAILLILLQSPSGDPTVQILGPHDGPADPAAIAPFETAVVWSNSTGSQIVGVVTGNLDTDSNDEVAAITQNGSLFLFDERGARIGSMTLGATPYSLATLDADGANPVELAIGTSAGFLVVGANLTVITNVTLASEVRVLHGADLDGNGLQEVVLGCDDSHTYAYDITGAQLWNYTSNAAVRLLSVDDVDLDGHDEVLAASQLRRLFLLDDNGTLLFEQALSSSITNIGLSDLSGDTRLEVVSTEASGQISIRLDNGTQTYSLTETDRVVSLSLGQLYSGGRPEVVAGLANGELRVYNSSLGLLWNKTLGSQIDTVAIANVGGLADS